MTIQITQNVINALSGETIITPEKIVKQIGQIYDKDSNYIFEIKENITIPTGKTLKGFKNIVVKPETGDVTINNGGTIEDCIITLNDSSKFYNGNNDEGNINNCTITLNDSSKFYNGYYDEGNINNCTITLYDSSKFYNGYYNESNIIGGSIILNNESKIYNNNSYIFICTITLNNSSEFYNYNNIINCTIILYSGSKFYNYNLNSNSYIFLYDEAILQNYDVGYNDKVYCGILTNSYIIVHDSCKIQNTYNDESGLFYNTYILKFSDDCTIDSEIEIDKIIIGSDMFILSKLISLYVDKIVNKLFSQIGLSKNAEELVKRIKLLLSNLPNDMSEQLLNKSSDSTQKLLLLLLLNKSDSDLTSNINRLLK